MLSMETWIWRVIDSFGCHGIYRLRTRSTAINIVLEDWCGDANRIRTTSQYEVKLLQVSQVHTWVWRKAMLLPINTFYVNISQTLEWGNVICVNIFRNELVSFSIERISSKCSRCNQTDYDVDQSAIRWYRKQIDDYFRQLKSVEWSSKSSTTTNEYYQFRFHWSAYHWTHSDNLLPAVQS